MRTAPRTSLQSVLKLTVWLVVVVLSLSLGSSALAYSDVKDRDLAQALTDLSRFQIVNGYEDGTFRPMKKVTRAEFAKLIIQTIKPDPEGSPAQDKTFPDVPASHWAYRFVNFARALEIINGFPDGTFHPDDSITYEQAIKMIVVALYYGHSAEAAGGYPDGYVTVASSLNILAGTQIDRKAEALRGVVATLLHNALNAPLQSPVPFKGIQYWTLHSVYDALYSGR